MDQYNGNAAAVWPTGISLPDDADLALGISSIDPALEALADRTAILKSKLGSWQITAAGSYDRGTWDPLTPLVSSQSGQGWTTPAGDSAMLGSPLLGVKRGDLVFFSASFVYSIAYAHDLIRVAYQKSGSSNWLGIDNPRIISLSNGKEGNATLTTTFVPYSYGDPEMGAIDMGVQLKGRVDVYGPINWTLMVLRSSGL